MSGTADTAAEWRALRGAVVLVVVLVAASVAGWLVHAAVTEPPTRLERTVRCLEKEKGLVVGGVGNDLIAASATEGSLGTVVDGNGLHLAIAATEDEAQALRRAYLRIDPALYLRNGVDRTVVTFWDYPPSDVQRRIVAECWY